jgi:hypothetical protein
MVRVELFDLEKATMIKAHDAELAHFALNFDGTRLATASDKGTLIRVWDAHTGEPLRELRRGTDRAEIYCIVFNPASSFLACSSDKGTVHIFALSESGSSGLSPSSASSAGYGAGSTLGGGSGANFTPNKADSGGGALETGSDEPGVSSQGSANKGLGLGMGFLRKMLPEGLVPKYFASEWSFAQVRGIEGRSVCAFVGDTGRLVVVCADGSFVLSDFTEGGDSARVAYQRIVRDRDRGSGANAPHG